MFTGKESQPIARLAQISKQLTASQQFKMATLSAHEKKHKVTVVGSGNWYANSAIYQFILTVRRGSTIAKIVAENTREHPDVFDPRDGFEDRRDALPQLFELV